MTFSIKCNKCGRVVDKLEDFTKYGYDNETRSDSDSTISVSSMAGHHGTSSLFIQCKCGNKE